MINPWSMAVSARTASQTGVLVLASSHMAKSTPTEAGQAGGQTGGSAGGAASGGSGGDDYKPTEDDGLREDGQPDRRVKGN